jgi:hypothetical protein
MRLAANLRRAGLCAGACVLLCSKSAQAGEGDARERSAALFREGVTAGKAGDYGRAEVAFRTSYLLAASPSALRNWALTEMKLGKMLEALGHLKLAMRSSGWTAEQRAIAQQNLDDAYAATGHLRITTTDGARVAIDGVLVEGAAPFDAPVDVTAGARQIEARLGSETAHAEVDAPAGRVVEISVPIPTTLEVPAPPPVARGPATEQEHSIPSAMADREPPRTATWWTTPHTVAVGLGAAAVAGVGLGLSFDAASHAAASDANALRAGLSGQCAGAAIASGCSALRDKIGTVHQDEAVEGVGFAVAAAAGVGAAVLLAVIGPGARARTGSVHWVPMVAPGSAGVAGWF